MCLGTRQHDQRLHFRGTDSRMRSPWQPCCVAVLIALAELLLQLHALNKSYVVEFDSVESTYDHNYFGERTGMALRQKDKTGHSRVSSFVDVINILPNDTVFDISLFEMHQKRYIQSSVKYRTNWCEYLRKENRPILRSLKVYYKFPSSCPVLGYYKCENERFEDIQPPFLPGPDNWKIVFEITSGGMSLLKDTVAFHVERPKKKRGY
ncbi:uncharacterized protein LOC117645527 [Thrips palmi]|uniref:Uncharacterized protein LOC117645527 n=1 Tax=Thrips palmi TaxID=161013 RepID=A0A6P8ZN41_THRPL|nr:uncharacterized protein LOC117645527 [Thrips palmi]